LSSATTKRFLRAACLAAAAACGCAGPSAAPAEADPRLPALRFEGNRAFSEAALREAHAEELARYAARGARRADVDDLAFAIEEYYREHGYPFAAAEYLRTAAGYTLRIAEGPRVTVEEVRIEGAAAFPPERLRALASLPEEGLPGFAVRPYVAHRVQACAAAIAREYAAHGYHEAAVEKPAVEFLEDGSRARVTIRLREGPQYVLERIASAGVPHLAPEAVEARIGYLRAAAYTAEARNELERAVEDLYADEGYPDARVATEEQIAGAAEPRARVAVTLVLHARPGPRTVVRAIIIRGNTRTAEGLILARMACGPGDLYRGAAVRRSFRRLFSTGLFASVDIRLSPAAAEAADGAAAERDLIVEVAEAPTLEYFFELGYGSYDLVRGKAGIRKKNLLGNGLAARAEIMGSVRGAEATVGLTAPWLFRSEWSADLPVTFLYREEPSYTIMESTTRLKLSRELAADLEGGAMYRFSLSSIEKYNVVELYGEQSDLRLGAAGPYLSYDSRDDFFTPSSGARVRLFGELGAPPLGSEIDFWHAGIAASAFVPLLSGTVLGANARHEWIAPFNDTARIPIQERLFNGGENSVRSFKQSKLGPRDSGGKPAGGEVRTTLSLELRQRVLGHLSAAAFGDYGNVALAAARPLEGFRAAVGGGLRYNLPIGPLRLDVGVNPRPRKEEDAYVIHFAVGMPF
jgi:outer membrane protein assembly complex protein YaeT